MRVDKSVIVLFRQMNLFLNRELLDEKLTSSDVLYLALLYEQDGRTQDEMAEAYPQPAGLGEEGACAAGSGYVRPTDSAGISDGESDAVPRGDTADGG